MNEDQTRYFEAIVSGLMDLVKNAKINTEMLIAISEKLATLEMWLKEPPKSDIGDLLRHLTVLVEQLPQAVVKALREVK